MGCESIRKESNVRFYCNNILSRHRPISRNNVSGLAQKEQPMNDQRLKRIIMENLPSTERGQATRIYLEIAVEQDLKSLGYEYCSQQFNRNLNRLHDMQHLVVFTNGWIRPTQAGLKGL